MDRHQVRLALLKITFMVLCGSTWVFWSFVFASRPEHPGQDALSTLVRLPASLPNRLPETLPSVFAAPKIAEPIAMDVIVLPCWDKQDTMIKSTSARWLRLTGKSCFQLPSNGEDIMVRNLSNGYMATVFAPVAGNLTTDFIPLQPGRNEIQIRFETEPGVLFESQFTFVRQKQIQVQ
jgi:hypothetical protein